MKSLIVKSFKDINFIAIIVVAICLSFLNTDIDTDFWSRLTCGSIYLQKGWVYYQDIFAFTDTKPYWVDHEWLSGIFFFLIIKYIGSSGIIIFKALCSVITISLIYFCARLREDSCKNIVFLIIVLYGLEYGLLTNIRPQVITYVFFSLWLLILEHSRINNTCKYLWLMPLTLLLWVNLHAGCIAGLALLIIYIFSQAIEKKKLKPYLLVLSICVLVLFLNPYTYHYFGYVYDELLSSHDRISEWEPVNLFDLLKHMYFKLLLGLTIIAYIFSNARKKDPVAVMLLVSLACFSFLNARHTILFIIIAGVFVYEHINNVYQRLIRTCAEKRSERYVNNLDFLFNTGIAVFIIIVFLPALFRIKDLSLTISGDIYPVSSINFIKENSLKGNILLPFKWGGFATWNLYPQNKVSVDGRYVEVYPEKIFKENNDFYYARSGWNKIFKDYQVDIVLLDRLNSPVCSKMLNNPKWKLIYTDKTSAVMLPANFPNFHLLKEPELESGSNLYHYKSWFLER